MSAKKNRSKLPRLRERPDIEMDRTTARLVQRQWNVLEKDLTDAIAFMAGLTDDDAAATRVSTAWVEICLASPDLAERVHIAATLLSQVLFHPALIEPVDA